MMMVRVRMSTMAVFMQVIVVVVLSMVPLAVMMPVFLMLMPVVVLMLPFVVMVVIVGVTMRLVPYLQAAAKRQHQRRARQREQWDQPDVFEEGHVISPLQ